MTTQPGECADSCASAGGLKHNHAILKESGNVSADRYPGARLERSMIGMLWPHLQKERTYTDFLHAKWVA